MLLKNREEYINALVKTPKASVFFQPWWLDVVCSNNWDVIYARDKGENIIGFLPYWKLKKIGLPVIIQPPLTPRLGIKYFYPSNIEKEDAKRSFEKKVCDQIIKQLPDHVFFSQMFDQDFVNWLPFYWRGFQQRTHYTYVLKNIKNHQTILSNVNPSVRNKIKNAQNKFTIESSDEIMDYYNIAVKTFQHQGLTKYYSKELLQDLYNVTEKNGKQKVLIAQYEGQPVAAIYVVMYNQVAYLLGAGIDRSHDIKGAIQLLIWEAIKMSSVDADIFDFEGSMIYNFEKVFRSFGSQQEQYFHLYKYKNVLFEIIHRIMK